MVYSQRDEEAVILANAPQSGRFLDCGASDGIIFSNTRALFDRGWSGVLVEPSPYALVSLMRNCRSERLTLINAAVTPDFDGLIELLATPNPTSTTLKPISSIGYPAESWPILTPAISVRNLISKLGGKFEFLNIDTEGNSYDILKAINLGDIGCNLVCVEKDGFADGIRVCFKYSGFNVIHETDENLIAKRIG